MTTRRQVKFVGNCQAAAMANLYREQIGNAKLEDVTYVDDLGRDADALRDLVADADVVVIQERDFKRHIEVDEQSAQVFHFPMIVAGFLWPYANEPHVHNVAERPISDGPYPSQMSDSFLNRLIIKGVAPEDALAQYRGLDIARTASLDRLKEIYLDKQRERDRATGYRIADEIEARFRTERLFLTAEHPDAYLCNLLSTQLFEKMGVAEDVRARIAAGLTRSLFPATELPLHPRVIAHFGLAFARPDDRYRYVDEGLFSFDEYVLRYMRYENNAELRKSLYMAGREDAAVTMERLENALERSPASERGLVLKGMLLEQLGRGPEAREAFKAATSVERVTPPTFVAYAQALARVGAYDRAEQAAQAALALDPAHGPALLTLAEINLRRGHVTAALPFAHAAVERMSGDGGVHRALAIAYMQTGEFAEAEQLSRRGMMLQPDVPDHYNLVAEVLEHRQRREEAVALLTGAVTTGRQNDQTYSLLGNFLLRAGLLARAEAAFAEGAARYGEQRPDLVQGLADVRKMQENALA